MDIQTKIDLIKEVGEEILTEEELKTLLETKQHPIAYDGFEPSGRIHIAQGILRAINVNKMTKAGIHFKMWVADWFGWMNNKMGGDLDKIQTVGKYFIEVWKASGMDLGNTEFVWAKDAMSDEEYWKRVVQIAKLNSVDRIKRCAQIMGRSETDTLSAAQIFYPVMQCTDIFHLKADITQLGMDQRKVNVLAREVAPKLGLWKPIVVSHHMLMGLTQPVSTVGEDKHDRTVALKMSKSNPDSAIFMTDKDEEINRKIKNAWCPEKQITENPILEYCKYIIFEKFKSINIERPSKFGGNIELHSYKELETVYREGKLHPMDLKTAVAGHINQLLVPVRAHFEKNIKARKLLETVNSFEVTR